VPRRLALAAFVAGATLAFAQSGPWPPPARVEARMHELQGILGSAESTREERDAARAELINLLKSPTGQDRPPRDEHPARAAIDPFPAIVKPAVNPALPSPPVAHVTVTLPPKPVVSPGGTAYAPSGSFAVDPRTGAVLHPLPGGGYVDPRTGRIVPN
jgi:hypothetical protein